jgi:hypothetical protein
MPAFTWTDLKRSELPVYTPTVPNQDVWTTMWFLGLTCCKVHSEVLKASCYECKYRYDCMAKAVNLQVLQVMRRMYPCGP